MSTTTTVRPASTIRNGSTLVGGATLHGVINDDSDSTLAQSVTNENNKIRFGAATLPAGAIVDHVVLRMRTSRFAGFPVVVVSGLNDKQTIQITPTTNDPTYATQSSAPQGGFSAAEVAAGVKLEWLTSGDNDFNLTEAYLDVTYIPIPTVNITAPTGTIGVTRPTVTWDFTGDYTQSSYQVKIFSQAQFDASGFNPTTSAAFYDSGTQVGTADEHTPTVNLTNTETYRFYVRVAQRVGSTTQWSDWDYEEITVSATPPAVPTITAVADDANARIKLTITDSDPWEFVTVQRTSDGTNWEAVRSATRVPVFGATFVLYDYESANGQDVQYRAQAIATIGDDDIASDWSTSTAPTSWVSTAIWLKAPLHPALNITVVVQDIPTLTYRLPQGRFDIAGRADPVVVSGTRHLSEGTVTFVPLTDAARVALLAILALSEVLLFQAPPQTQATSIYMAIGDVNENRVTRDATEPTRLVECPFTEVLSPVGDIVGFGVSWDDVLTLYADWQAVADDNTSWLDLLEA